MKAYWLIKTEPEVYSIDDLKRDRTTLWGNVRNYQARNYMRDSWQPGDTLFFYHSNSDPSGIVGLAEVLRCQIPDPSQFDSSSDYFDPKATKDAPRWVAPEIRFKKLLPKCLAIQQLRTHPGLRSMALLQRGSRLSVQPVTSAEAKILLGMVNA